MRHAHLRFTVLFLLTATPAFASLPVTAKFRAPDVQPLMGGPVFLVFELTNNGAKPVRIRYAQSSSPCAGYHITIDGEHRADGTCNGTVAFSCSSASTVIAPGAKWSEQIFLNRYYEFSHTGVYHVHAVREVDAHIGGRFEDPLQQQVFTADVDLTLKDGSPAELRAAFAPVVKNLAADDLSMAFDDAVEILTTLAPPFLEGELIKLLDTDNAGQALAGLAKLKSARAQEAVVHIAANGVPVDPKADDLTRALRYDEQAFAVQALGNTGDNSYFPLLLRVTRDAPIDGQLRMMGVYAIAHTGHSDALPFLESEASGRGIRQRFQATLATGETGSRDAVPVLIELLGSKDPYLRSAASTALERITHRHWNPPASAAPPSDDDTESGTLSPAPPDPPVYDVSPAEGVLRSAAWSAWWNLNGASATIYSPGECSEDLPIN